MSRGYQPDWDFDVAQGEAQELRVEGLLSDLRNGGTAVEVKSDFYCNAYSFLEAMDRRAGRADWRATGFRTSKAALFVLNKPSLNSLHVYRTEDLRDLEAAGLLGRLIDGGVGGDCPTRGYRVTASQLDGALAWMARGRDELFDQEVTA